MKYRELRRHPAVFQSFTGLNLVAFSELLPAFERAYQDDLEKREQERERRRQRERGAGRSGALISLENKLLFIRNRISRLSGLVQMNRSPLGFQFAKHL